MKIENRYKIQNIKTKKFSTGGACPGFTNQGKLWAASGLGSHLSILKKYDNIKAYKNCQIIVYELKQLSKKEMAKDNMVIKFEAELFKVI